MKREKLVPTDEEMQAAVEAAKTEAIATAEKAAEDRIKAAANGKFTQEDLDRIAGASRTDGRDHATKELLKELGFEDLDTAKAARKAQTDAEEAGKTELQKALDRAAALELETEAAKSEARSVLVSTRLENELRDAGANPDRLALALRNVDATTLSVEDGKVTGAKEAVAALKEATPEWFGGTGSAPPVGHEGDNKTDFRTDPEARRAALRAAGIRV